MAESNAEFIGPLDHIRVLQGSGGSDHRFDARGGGNFKPVRKREEPVAGHDRAFESGGAGVFLFELFDRLLNRADAVLFAGSDREGLTVLDDHNAVGTDGDVDVPCGEKIALLLFCRLRSCNLDSGCLAFSGRRGKITEAADVRQERSGNDQRAVAKNFDGVVDAFRIVADVTRNRGKFAALENADLFVEFETFRIAENFKSFFGEIGRDDAFREG